jgi:hypothetical protein
MKPPKIFLVFLILLASIEICFGQKNTISEPFDEFGEINCDDFLGRLDNFLVALRNDPASSGYAVIHGKKENQGPSYRYRSRLRGHIKFRGFDLNRVTIIRGEESENLKIQLWVIRAGTDPPSNTNLGWDYPFSTSKARKFYRELNDGGYCPSDILITFSEILTQRSEIRGHFVIHARSIKAFNERKKELLNEFSDIPSNRLRFFYVRNSNDTFVEYWLVPPKKK